MESLLTAVTLPRCSSMVRKSLPLGTVYWPWMAPRPRPAGRAPGPPPGPWPRLPPKRGPGAGWTLGAALGLACGDVVVVLSAANDTPIQPARMTAVTAAPTAAARRHSAGAGGAGWRSGAGG